MQLELYFDVYCRYRMQLYGLPRTRAGVTSPSIRRRAQAPEAPTLPSLIDVAPPEAFDPLTAMTTGDESEHCGMQGMWKIGLLADILSA